MTPTSQPVDGAEQQPAPSDSATAHHHHRRRRRRRVMKGIATGLLVYVAVAYLLLPLLWSRYEKRAAWLDDVTGVTQTRSGIPGDPLNVALVATENELQQALAAAHWDPADPLGLRSDLEIAADTVLRRAYEDAPVSNLYLFGRKEDLAFEQPVGGDPRRRHHVRFWRAPRPHDDGRPVWLGAVTFDQRVGLSHTTGQITHHIAPDVDAERDYLLEALARSGWVSDRYYVDNFHPVRTGRNGGGDPWHTDGRLAVGVLLSSAGAGPAAPSAGPSRPS